MNPAWAITPEKIELAIQRIIAIANPRMLIIFGSASRGTTNRDSDVDFLVVKVEEVESPRRESARIRRALRGICMPMDIIVVGESQLRELDDRPGLIYREAIRSGKVVYEFPR